ncbi:MAG: bifunctional D-glycero-beta-D-manno-heptose-7-phosphate kinase/D-glycero-beta-D-manno-heptose 1-phosphate adenylyltransferase HldE [Desulfobacteraceae bacterium]|nr:MAG: bifunctional D-glycero-beta-D-manno-heptose-7-phosphate kinase/D-glycero-beta-D-manno-heptose 1-phosphate adenylyltransferase HldE [Desulfobacteraceae bacterium]
MNDTTISFANIEILVIGDIMLDRYLWGKVGRISPEAPVPVVKVERTTETLGGAGNVALNLVSLGCRATVIGLCGADSTARTLRELICQKGLVDRLVVDELRPTITKTRIMAQKQQMLRLDEESTHAMGSEAAEKVHAAVSEALTRCHALILSDYGKGLFASEAFVQEVIRTARRLGKPVLVDPKGADWKRYHSADGVTPNTAELEAVAGGSMDGAEARLIAAARQIRSRYDLKWLLVTRGPQGMCLIDASGEPVLIPAQAREVYDVSGAGDTVIATLAAGLAAGLALTEAARTANLAAGIVVGKLGTQPILWSELATALKYSGVQRNYPFSAAKMTAFDAALAKVREWKASGTRIVFTNGCFDLLHPGHISLLYQARALGDRLVVGLNTDASIRRLKGSGRPILSEQDRAAMLSALECVDLVVHFDEDTPVRLIETIRPDVLVKGSDYTPDKVVGKEIVEAYGGCVKLVDLIQGYSTTQLTQKVISEFQKTQRG